jgi:hypothetical protein
MTAQFVGSHLLRSSCSACLLTKVIVTADEEIFFVSLHLLLTRQVKRIDGVAGIRRGDLRVRGRRTIANRCAAEEARPSRAAPLTEGRLHSVWTLVSSKRSLGNRISDGHGGEYPTRASDGERFAVLGEGAQPAAAPTADVTTRRSERRRSELDPADS